MFYLLIILRYVVDYVHTLQFDNMLFSVYNYIEEKEEKKTFYV